MEDRKQDRKDSSAHLNTHINGDQDQCTPGCGLGPWRPRCLQIFAKPIISLILLNIYCILEGAIVTGTMDCANNIKDDSDEGEDVLEENKIVETEDSKQAQEADVKSEIISVGDKFSSKEEMIKQIQLYEDASFVKFWMRDARTIENALEKGRVERHLNPKLYYYQVKYTCIQGGQEFRPKGKGIRNTSTYKNKCPANILVKVDKSGEQLEVTAMRTDHNHPISERLYKHYPHNRKLTGPLKDKAISWLSMKANKKIVQQAVCSESGNVILLKDLSNLAANIKKQTGNDLDDTVKMLMEKHGANVEISVDDNKQFSGLFVQDKQMKNAFEAYPELICIDATYKLLKIGLPVYLMLCEDSNGQSEIVALCMIASEDATSIRWMLDTFKTHNEKWTNVRAVMADKDIKERDVVKELFPDSFVLICLFHTLRTFNREVKCDKMGITAAQRTLSLEMIQKLAYAASEAEYQKLYDSFQSSCPKAVVEYYNKNWHPIKDEWVLSYKATCGSFLNMTNNRLESINGKLKQVISRNSSLYEFFEKFFVILQTLRTERDHKAALTFQKTKVFLYQKDSAEMQYSELLTSYASCFVVKQLRLVTKVKDIRREDDAYIVNTNDGDKVVTQDSCECIFYQSMRLPCRHMFSLRKQLGVSLFDTTICDKRWTVDYYQRTHRIFSDSIHQPSSVTIAEIDIKPQRRLSQQEKFRKASICVTELASVASEASHVHFYRKVELMEKLCEYWKSGKEVGLILLDEDESNCKASEDDDEHIKDKPYEDKPSSKPSKLDASENEPSDDDEVVGLDGNNYSLSNYSLSVSDGKFEMVNVTTASVDLNNNAACEAGSFETTDRPIHGHSDVECDKPSRLPMEADSKETDSPLNLGITMPPVIRKRGRPKGHLLTTIGLPSKKTKYASKPCSFERLGCRERERVMLEWFVSSDAAEKCLDGELIESIERRPEKISNSCLDENVNIFEIRKHFTSDMWKAVLEIIECKREHSDWLCNVCYKDLEDQTAICCDSCLTWFHLNCAGLTKIPKRKEWFCRTCFSKSESVSQAQASSSNKQLVISKQTEKSLTSKHSQRLTRISQMRAQWLLESKIERYKLYDKSFLSLILKDEWVSDEVISAYIHVLIRRNDLETTVHVMDTSITSKICNGVFFNHDKKLINLDIPKYEKIIGAFLQKGNHWVLLVIERDSSTIMYIDPKGERDAYIQKLTKHWNVFSSYHYLSQTWQNLYKWTIVTRPHCLQRDNVSCGVYVMKFAEYILKGRPLPSKLTNLYKMRNDMAVDLLEESETLDDYCHYCGMISSHDDQTYLCRCDDCGWGYHQYCIRKECRDANKDSKRFIGPCCLKQGSR